MFVAHVATKLLPWRSTSMVVLLLCWHAVSLQISCRRDDKTFEIEAGDIMFFV